MVRGPGPGPSGSDAAEGQPNHNVAAAPDPRGATETLAVERREVERLRARLDEERAALHVMRTELERGRAELNAARRELDRERFNLQWDRAALGGERSKIEKERARVESDRARLGMTPAAGIDGRPAPWLEADEQTRGEARSRMVIGGVVAAVLLLLALLWLAPQRNEPLTRLHQDTEDLSEEDGLAGESGGQPLPDLTAPTAPGELDEPALVDKPGAEPPGAPVVAAPSGKPNPVLPAKPAPSPAPSAPPAKPKSKGIDELFDF